MVGGHGGTAGGAGQIALAQPSAIDLAKEIIEATKSDSLDRAALTQSCNDLFQRLKSTGVPLAYATAVELLNALRKARAFAELALLGDRLIALGRGELDLRRLTAQGLIDAGQPASALDVLEAMLKQPPVEDGSQPKKKEVSEYIEARGLAGRARKQIFVDVKQASPPAQTHPLPNTLVDALASYATGYRASLQRREADPGEWSWHGINVVALLKRAKREGIDVATDLDADRLAHDIIAALEAPGRTPQPWDLASIGEAYIALGEWDRAEAALTAYAQHGSVNAFQLGGTIRQLEEVWQLQPGDHAAGRILYLLNTRQLNKDKGHISLTANDRQGLLKASRHLDEGKHEAILSHGRPLPINWLNIGLERANAVAKITTLRGWPQGTGFLVRGGDFIASYGDRPLLLTNAHVVSEMRSELEDPHASLHPKKAKVTFTSVTAVGDRVKRYEYTCRKVVFESPRSALDFALVELHPDVEEMPICELSDKVPQPGKSRLLIIGHPDGRPLEISLFEAPLLHVGHKIGGETAHRYLHYTNPTEGGSSGSPVFDAEHWMVVGLHHAGSVAQSKIRPAAAGKGRDDDSGVANEGILIHAIREAAAGGAANRTTVAAGGPARAMTGGSTGTLQRAAAPAPATASAMPPASAPMSATSGKLAHDIPPVMTDWRPHNVKARISRKETTALLDGLKTESGIAVEDIAVSAVMSVRLVAPGGGFTIQPLSPETQFVGVEQGALSDVSEWVWSVRPEVTGQHQLELVIALREQRAGGIADLPGRQQTVPVRVRVNIGRRVGGISRWAAVAIGSGALALLGQWLIKGPLAQPLLKLLT